MTRFLRTLRSPLALSLAALLAFVTFVFYSTRFSTHVEEYLFDTRTRLKPKRQTSQDPILITVDPGQQEADDEGDAPDALDELLSVTRLLLNSHAERIAVLFFPNVYDYSDPRAAAFIQMIEDDRRFFVGTLGQDTAAPSGVELPPLLRPVYDRVYGVDTLKKRSNSVVRALPLAGYRGLSRRPLLPAVLADLQLGGAPDTSSDARLVGDAEGGGLGWYTLNFLSSDSFVKVTGTKFLSRPLDVSGRLVLVGPTVFREWMTQTREQIVTNTPLRGQVDTYRLGEPILTVVANAVQNLRSNAWLKPVPGWVPAVQTAAVTMAFAFVWRAGVVWAAFLVIGGWALLMLVHGWLFHFFGIFVPLADTALFSSFAVMVGAVARLNVDLALQARIRTETETKSALARTQSRYLDRFSAALSEMNAALLAKLQAAEAKLAKPDDLLGRAALASTDFAEYLGSIKEAAAAEVSVLKPAAAADVAVAKLLAAVATRFEPLVEEKRLDFAWACEPADLTVRTNERLLDNIVYNLVSNAMKYSHQGGRVRVTAEARPRGGARIVVRDEGPGIPVEFQERIFEKFYRIKNDQVYKVKGTGLGLYLCRYFAAHIGATVRCESTVGAGSTFMVELGGRT